MRRIMFTAVASLAILAIAPASVLAKHHNKRHHSRTHHARVRHERFGTITPTAGAPTTAPTTPTTTADTAGTVNSFNGTTLVIKLTDGTLVSGAVTPNTEIECAAADMNDTNDTMHADGDHGGPGGDNSSGGGDNSSGGGDNSGGDGGDQGDENGAQNASCTSANLVMNAVVQGAELRISSAGATWDKVELGG
jgi:hypothetical protein